MHPLTHYLYKAINDFAWGEISSLIHQSLFARHATRLEFLFIRILSKYRNKRIKILFHERNRNWNSNDYVKLLVDVKHQPKTIPNRYVIWKAKSKQKCCSVIVNEIYHGQNNRIDWCCVSLFALLTHVNQYFGKQIKISLPCIVHVNNIKSFEEKIVVFFSFFFFEQRNGFNEYHHSNNF